MRRAASLMCSLANGAAAPAARDVYPKRIEPRRVALASGHVSRLLGAEVAEQEIRVALEGIGCAISPGEEDGWRVSAPTWRPDLSRPEDLIEEVARVRGYDSIPTSLPRVLPSGRGVAPRPRAARRLPEAAADLGLLEAVSFAFVSARGPRASPRPHRRRRARQPAQRGAHRHAHVAPARPARRRARAATRRAP
ncbi:MAG: hypothetical protein M5U28_49595 [Sandaracinaceae bacterium]|nr:hypothetical protein [Sandaracinaceae bacterium]